MPSRHLRPVEISCPTSGALITVMKSTRDDPVAALHIEGQITPTQYDALMALRADREELSGDHRAPSRGPEDFAWRGKRPAVEKSYQPRRRLDRVHAKLSRADAALIYEIGIVGRTPSGDAELQQLRLALDCLAQIYGLAGPTRH